MKDRITYYDVLRAIAIIGIIAAHAAGIGYQFTTSNINFWGTVIWREITNFSVPLFIALSGFFLAKKNVETPKEYRAFINKQLLRVLIPFISWSVIYTIISYIYDTPIKTLLLRFFTFQATGAFYFIILIIQLYLLLPILKKVATKKGIIICTLISLLMCSIFSYLRYFKSINPPPIIIGGPFTTWIMFFVIGIYCGKTTINISNITLILSAILFLILSIFETYFIFSKTNDIYNAVTGVKISCFLYATSIILLLFKNANNKNYKILPYIGQVSFGIYLSHIIFLTFVSGILNKIAPILNSYGLVKQLLLITFTTLSCLIFASIVRKINRKFATKYLGQ